MKHTTPKKYIGITGFKTREEIHAAYRTQDTHCLMYGILSSHNRLLDIYKSGRLSPALKDIPQLLDTIPRGDIAAIHYHTTNRETLAQEIDEMLTIADKNNACDMLQINMDWPPVTELKKIKTQRPELKLLLQLNNKALTDNEPTLYQIALRTLEYDCIDYILIDQSGGKGIPLDPIYCDALVQIIKKDRPNTEIVVAGGLMAENLEEKLGTIIKHTKISIDAEGKLRDEKGINIKKMRDYILKGEEIL